MITGYQITKREREVLQLLSEGLDSYGVASTLGISMNTVKSHRRGILEGMRAFNMSQAVANAFRAGMLR